MELGRKAVRHIVEDILTRCDVDLDIAPFLRRYFGEAAFHERLAGETIWMIAAWPAARSCSTAAISVGAFIAVMRWFEEALLGALEGERAADLALAFSVPVSPVTLAASSAAVKVIVDHLKSAGIGVIDAGLLRRQPMLHELIGDTFIGE